MPKFVMEVTSVKKTTVTIEAPNMFQAASIAAEKINLIRTTPNYTTGSSEQFFTDLRIQKLDED